MANIISSMKITNPIKEMVSKSKKRYMDDRYNLDLSCKLFKCSPHAYTYTVKCDTTKEREKKQKKKKKKKDTTKFYTD